MIRRLVTLLLDGLLMLGLDVLDATDHWDCLH